MMPEKNIDLIPLPVDPKAQRHQGRLRKSSGRLRNRQERRNGVTTKTMISSRSSREMRARLSRYCSASATLRTTQRP
jgi:hypothetical protein